MKLLEPPIPEQLATLLSTPPYSQLEALCASQRLGFMQGAVGVGFFALARRAYLKESDELVEGILERSVELFNRFGANAGLHSGIAGLGLLASHIPAAPAELLEAVDAAVHHHLRSGAYRLSLREGLAGFAMYAARRLHMGAGRELAADIVRALEAHAEVGPQGRTWQTPVDYAKARGVELLSEPMYEAGMAHGQAGILAGLASLADAGFEAAKALIPQAIDWTWAAAQPGDNRFAWLLYGADGRDGKRVLNVNAWCTGDPGVARAIWLSARACGLPKQLARALELARLLATEVVNGRSAGLPERFDLCCGASGVGQIFARFFEETGEDCFRSAAHKILTACWAALPGVRALEFQFGRTGILAALIGASSDAPLCWDVILGISTPGPTPNEGLVSPAPMRTVS